MPLRISSIQRRRAIAATLIALGCASPPATTAHANSNDRCTNTATAAQRACKQEVASNYWLARGMCENLPAAADRAACFRDAAITRQSDSGDCLAQLSARRTSCDDLGENAYAPAIVPANFTTTIDNPFLPLVPGTTFVYDNTNGETVTVAVTHDTQEILGVTSVVVHDTAAIGANVIEDTLDYYAQDLQGNVWYLGEDTAEYDHGIVIGVGGAWRAGVNGAKPGIVMKANPSVGDVYRQEFLLGEAEDQARIVATNANATVPFGGTYTDCLETTETSSLEPDANESKFFAGGVGLVLVIDNATGDREELVSVTVEP